MSVFLLDINVLVALLWANHEQHHAATSWFGKHQQGMWATCPLTQAGFVRISSNPRVFPDAPSPAKAIELLEADLRHPRHCFWKDEIPFAVAIACFGNRFTGHQQVSDAYLFGLAIHKGGLLVTFDPSIAALVEPESRYLQSLEILSA
jgi:toxin-antitoxin system PIN domain toxin